MSEVYRARDLRMGRDVAVKVLRADLARDPSAQSRFRREAQNAASLNHPSIVAVYDTGEAQGEAGVVPYIVMEYVDGETLRDIVARDGALPPRRALEIAAEICAALDFSHRHGIVHRDITPANVMVNRDGTAKVMDFGVARAVKNGHGADHGHHDHRYRAVPLARTGARRDRRRPLRHLFGRLRALRIALRHTAFHRCIHRSRLPPSTSGWRPGRRASASRGCRGTSTRWC